MDFESFVLAASTADLGDEPAARDHADALEFRLDLADDGVDALRAYEGELPLIVTNRATWEGGEAADTPDRLAALDVALALDAVAAIDVELETVRDGEADELIAAAAEWDVSVIVSVHDFETTPSRKDMRALLEEAAAAGDVGKLAVTATDRADVLELILATHERTMDGHRVATMAMGEAGRHSRAVTPLYGSRIGYAPVQATNATAPGQYDLATLRSLVDSLVGGDGP